MTRGSLLAGSACSQPLDGISQPPSTGMLCVGSGLCLLCRALTDPMGTSVVQLLETKPGNAVIGFLFLSHS